MAFFSNPFPCYEHYSETNKTVQYEDDGIYDLKNPMNKNRGNCAVSTDPFHLDFQATGNTF